MVAVALYCTTIQLWCHFMSTLFIQMILGQFMTVGAANRAETKCFEGQCANALHMCATCTGSACVRQSRNNNQSTTVLHCLPTGVFLRPGCRKEEIPGAFSGRVPVHPPGPHYDNVILTHNDRMPTSSSSRRSQSPYQRSSDRIRQRHSKMAPPTFRNPAKPAAAFQIVCVCYKSYCNTAASHNTNILTVVIMVLLILSLRRHDIL